MKEYPREAIEMLSNHINKKTEGFNWLINNNYPELLATLDAIRDDKKSFNYLMENKHFILAAFVNAIWDDSKAFQLLIDQKAYDWAACANFINGDDSAKEALIRGKKIHFINLGLAIQNRIHEDGDRNVSPWGAIQNMFNIKKIFKKDENS